MSDDRKPQGPMHSLTEEEMTTEAVVDRRSVLTLMGGGVAATVGVSGCVPFVAVNTASDNDQTRRGDPASDNDSGSRADRAGDSDRTQTADPVGRPHRPGDPATDSDTGSTADRAGDSDRGNRGHSDTADSDTGRHADPADSD